MFARPKSARVNQRQNLASVEHTFTQIIGPAISQSTLSSSSKSTATTSSSNSGVSSRTGDGQSFSFNSNDPFYVEKRMCQRGYRILSYKEDRNGRKVVFDVLDGTIYNCCGGLGKKVTNNATIFDSKKSAMSERFPSNQFGASVRSGNGVHPKVLVAFDGWGQCKRRLGGGPSTMFEFIKFMGIVEFLDPPTSNVNRQCVGYVEPHYFPKADRHPTTRQTSERALKLDRSFEPTGYANRLF